ncbi:MAG: sulfatase [Bacteroidetes bacterium]|nr:sulfatase [Bacteroidota bacterium]
MEKKPNVLFLVVDDLRPELGCYGNSGIISPNIDRIADKGLLFNNAFCQFSVCNPSRVSVLSGCRFFRNRIIDESIPPDVVSLPQLFKNEGYSTVSIGKVYHFNDDDPDAWTRKYTDTFYKDKHGYSAGYQLESNIKVFDNYFKKLIGDGANLPRPGSTEVAEAPDEAYPDGIIANQAIEELRRLKTEGNPFFLAAGFYRPHLPFAVPQKYWDMYEPDDIRTAPNPQSVIDGVTKLNWDELRRYGDIPNEGELTFEKAKELIHGYYASVTFSDTQIGKIMSELEYLGLDKNTIVVLWGDHGWNLGEHGWWCKHTNYEVSNRTVMIISTPDIKKGQVTDALVELVDIYPSLCELVGIKVPSCIEGTSFIPLIKEPDHPWKEAVFSQIGGASTIRTKDYRLIKHKNDSLVELFDHVLDPGENINVANKPEYIEIQNALLNQLERGWEAAQPNKSIISNHHPL